MNGGAWRNPAPAWDKIIDTRSGGGQDAALFGKHSNIRGLESQIPDYLRNKPPDELSPDDVKALSHLSGGELQGVRINAEPGVQRFVFLYRHILKKISAITRTFHVQKKSRSIYPRLSLSRKGN